MSSGRDYRKCDTVSYRLSSKDDSMVTFNDTTDFREHDTAVIFMCVDEYFNLPYGAGIAVHHGDLKLMTAIQVMAMFLLYSVRYGQYESDK